MGFFVNTDVDTFSPALLKSILANFKSALLSTLQVHFLNVGEDDSSSDATVFIKLVESCDFFEGSRDMIRNAKQALFDAVALTQTTYVFGFEEDASQGFGDICFTAILLHLPPNKKEEACWESFENGHCPRPGTCRWYHPRPVDKRRIRIRIEEQEKF